jgi:hypothetical protein
MITSCASAVVLVFDDFWSSGQSLFSYALALRAAGAREIRGVVLQHTAKSDYYAVYAWLRRVIDLAWRPERAAIAFPPVAYAQILPYLEHRGLVSR